MAIFTLRKLEAVQGKQAFDELVIDDVGQLNLFEPIIESTVLKLFINMTRAELLSSEGYWLATIQLDLYNQLETYLKEKNMSRTQLAEQLGVTKGYVSQVLNGDFDHKISKLVELSLAIGLVPTISYKPIQQVLEDDRKATNPAQSERELAHA